MVPSDIYCPSCGAANQAQNTFCFACGKPLQTSASSIQYPTPGTTNGALTGLLVPNSELKQRYRILTKLGRGGFGAVYKAVDTQFHNRLIAIKEMSQSGMQPDAVKEAVKAFEREAQMLTGLMHPNLPRIYDHFSEGGRWYLVMDFIEGETLEEHLNKAKNGYLSIEETLQIGIQLCAVLTYLHTRQPPIIFRDLKPANIMLTPDAHVYLIDFGIARLFKPGQTKDTIAFGSLGYAAPEQYGKSQTTVQSDIYSLGTLLHQLLTGNDPSANTPTPFDFPVLRVLGRSTPVALEMLIMQMLEKDASKRPPSIAEVKNKLQQILAAQVTGQIHPVQPGERSQLRSTRPVGETPPFPIRFPARSLRVPAIIAAIIVVVIVIAFSISPLLHNSVQSSSQSTLNSSSNIPTSAPTATPFPTAVPPTPSPTSQPGPGTVLCQADASHGWNGWNGTSDWKILNGMLLSDGTYNILEGPPTIVAPCQLGSITNYAAEANIQVLKNSYPTCFGIDVRGTPTPNGWQGYVGTVYVACNNGNDLLALNTDNMNNVNLTSAPFSPGTSFHTYRVEVKDNQIRFLIDGAQLLAVSDNQYLSGEQVGLWSYDAQLVVSSFKVIAL